jgi:hypothetical protein
MRFDDITVGTDYRLSLPRKNVLLKDGSLSVEVLQGPPFPVEPNLNDEAEFFGSLWWYGEATGISNAPARCISKSKSRVGFEFRVPKPRLFVLENEAEFYDVSIIVSILASRVTCTWAENLYEREKRTARGKYIRAHWSLSGGASGDEMRVEMDRLRGEFDAMPSLADEAEDFLKELS